MGQKAALKIKPVAVQVASKMPLGVRKNVAGFYHWLTVKRMVKGKQTLMSRQIS